jgi:predicted DsbA family dithiol-disulfide isomerase
VSEGKGSLFAAAVTGGSVGSLATAVLLVALAPQLVGPRIVREGLIREPAILVEAGDALRARQYSTVLEPIRARLETPFQSSWKGAAKPEVTLTYFYDYACGYCRQSNPVLERLLAEDKGLRVVYRELPILGQDSVAAARVSLAASKAGRFAQFHDALYAAGRPSPETIAAAANGAGVTPDMARDPAIESEIRQNMEFAGQLGATGTPLFVIGGQVHNSAVGYERLKQAIAAARSNSG